MIENRYFSNKRDENYLLVLIQYKSICILGVRVYILKKKSYMR